ncbi:MAG: outer membrane protein transport protein [Chromatiales bacterium]|jgi:long-chain fatty acid transport protein
MKREPRPCKLVSSAALAASVSLASGSSLAAGFALIEQSVSGLGNAFAGGAAQAEDASAMFFNPAAMSELKGTQVSFGAHYINPESKLKDGTASVSAIGGTPTDFPVSGSLGGNAGQDAVVPHFHVVTDITDVTKFGLGISVPFGLETDYDDDWIGRYHALQSRVRTVNINPALSLKVHEKVSFGFGFNAQYIDAKLTSAIDSGSTCFALAAQGGLDPNVVCAPAGLTPANQATDSFGEFEGDDWAFGYNLGLMFSPWESTRFGLAYRSKLDQNVTGDGKFSLSPQFGALIDGLDPPRDTLFSCCNNVAADVTLPASASVSALHKLGQKFEIMGDITWTQWSEFDELRVRYIGSAVQPDAVTTQDWDDSFRYSIGLSYILNEKIKLRTGLAYDETPIKNPERRTPRIPGEDRIWTALGLTWQATEKFSFDVAYAHLFVDDPKINNTTEGTVEHTLQGEYDASVDIVSAQVNYVF